MKQLLSRFERPPKTLFLFGLLVTSVVWLIAIGLVWWQSVYASPEQVFKGMLSRNFTTDGYTRTVDIDENGLVQTQRSQVQTGAENVAVSQVESKSEQGDIQVAEVVATPDADYVRYIDLTYTDDKGNEQDLSDAENVWARQPSSGSLSQSYAQLTLFRTYFPMGSMKADDRTSLLQFIEQNTVYGVDYDNANKENVQGQTVYTFPVTVQLQAYTDMVRQFGESIGQTSAVSGLDPAQAAGSEPVHLRVSVDIASRRLVQVRYADSDNITETYAGFGIHKEVTIPEEYISTQELQQRLVPAN